MAPTVGDSLIDLMSSRDWKRRRQMATQGLSGIAPTLVGGSKKHGGPDLGPTRERESNGQPSELTALALQTNHPGPDLPVHFTPRLTVRMAARIQGFPDSWIFSGGKTASYRQVGNAFPPPVAQAVGDAIRAVFVGTPTRPRRVQMPLFEMAR